jgi:hypothetical protein
MTDEIQISTEKLRRIFEIQTLQTGEISRHRAMIFIFAVSNIPNFSKKGPLSINAKKRLKKLCNSK